MINIQNGISLQPDFAIWLNSYGKFGILSADKNNDNLEEVEKGSGVMEGSRVREIAKAAPHGKKSSSEVSK